MQGDVGSCIIINGTKFQVALPSINLDDTDDIGIGFKNLNSLSMVTSAECRDISFCRFIYYIRVSEAKQKDLAPDEVAKLHKAIDSYFGELQVPDMNNLLGPWEGCMAGSYDGMSNFFP